MTTFRFLVVGNNMTSMIDGFGKEELEKILDKMNADHKWHLEICSEAILKQTKVGKNINGDKGLDINLFC